MLQGILRLAAGMARDMESGFTSVNMQTVDLEAFRRDGVPAAVSGSVFPGKKRSLRACSAYHCATEAYDLDAAETVLESLTRSETVEGSVAWVHGTLALLDRFHKYYDFSIFVAADSDVRLSRMLLQHCGNTPTAEEAQVVADYYIQHCKPCFEQVVEPTRKVADIIIPNESDSSQIQRAAELVLEHVVAKLLPEGGQWQQRQQKSESALGK